MLMKKGLASFSYLDIGMLRIASAWVFTVLIAFRRFKKFERRFLWPLIAVGFFGNGIPYLLFPLAIGKLDSSLVGILNSMVPLFTLIIGIIWFKIRVRWLSALGITLGFLGAVWLLVPDLDVATERLIYGLFPVLATLCYAISINVINTHLSALSSVGITLLSLTSVGPFTLAYVLGSDIPAILGESQEAWWHFGYIIILGVFGSSLAIVVFNMLIKGTSSLFAASVTYAIPVVALLWGIWDGEAIGMQHVGGLLLILLGIYLINRRGSANQRIAAARKKKKPTP